MTEFINDTERFNKIFNDDISESIIRYVCEKEMTNKQCTVYKMIHYDKLTQNEVARKLVLSQPTVSRHFKVAEEIIQRFMNCVFYVLNDCYRLQAEIKETKSIISETIEKVEKPIPDLSVDELNELLNN